MNFLIRKFSHADEKIVLTNEVVTGVKLYFVLLKKNIVSTEEM